MEHQSLVKKACDYIFSHQEQVKRGNYPDFHLAAPYGWINDPNGFFYALGKYHIFYQHYPYDAKWGPMHWGHATSADLIHWDHQKVALAPSEPYDKDGCFSGSAIEFDDKLYLIYTGHVWLKEPGNDDAIREVQCLAVSEDGINFKKLGVIIEPPSNIMHFRDPKVFREEDHFALVLGARIPKDDGFDEAQVLKYTSTDLKTWHLQGPILKAPAHEAFMYECPDTFPLDGKQVIALSPMGLKPYGIERNNPSINSYAISDNKDLFDAKDLTEIDSGHDFYASQTMQSPDGRRIMLAWLTMWKLPFASYDDAWCGMLTLPRELSLKDGKLIQKPISEVTSLFKKERNFGRIDLENATFSLKKEFKPCKINFSVNLQEATAETLGLSVDEALTLYFDRQHQELTLLRREKGSFSPRSIKVNLNKPLEVEIFLDKSSIEVFVNGGEHTFTSTYYSGKRDDLYLFAHNGQASFDEVKVTNLKKVLKKKRLTLD